MAIDDGSFVNSFEMFWSFVDNFEMFWSFVISLCSIVAGQPQILYLGVFPVKKFVVKYQRINCIRRSKTPTTFLH
jgi:hypothetical protein